MEARDLDHALEVERDQRRFGDLEEVVVILEVREHRGWTSSVVSMRSGGAAASSFSSSTRSLSSESASIGLAGDVADLSLDLRRLGERAQLQADDGALDPGARLGEGAIAHRRGRRPGHFAATAAGASLQPPPSAR